MCSYVILECAEGLERCRKTSMHWHFRKPMRRPWWRRRGEVHGNKSLRCNGNIDTWWCSMIHRLSSKKCISKPHDIIRCNTHLILEKLLAVALPSFSCIIPVGIRFMLPMGIDQGHMRSSGQVSRAYAGRSFDGKKLRVCMGEPAPCKISAEIHRKIMPDRNARGHESF